MDDAGAQPEGRPDEVAERRDAATPRRAVIVAGVDGSETSMNAGAYAAGVARRLHGTLVIVYVHTISGLSATTPASIPALQEAQRDVVAEIRGIVERGQRATVVDGLPPLEVELVERTGNPFKEIVAVATERLADAVVVGASMQAGHRLVGSLAVHLVRTAQWPVTVVP